MRFSVRPASPARASRARPPASRLSFFLERESAELGGLGEATGPAGARAGTNPARPPSHAPWDGCGRSAARSAISP